VVVPGGFSYGDYLRAGAIAAHQPVLRAVVNAASRRTPILGICNGFQILCEANLLPGALVRNAGLHFLCRDQRLRVESNATAWTGRYAPGAEIVVPLKSIEGRYVADELTLAALEGDGRVVFRYLGGNPNGAVNDIAGITSADGRVVGVMPHPEHAVEALNFQLTLLMVTIVTFGIGGLVYAVAWIVAAVAALLALTALLSACGGGSSEDSPEKVIEQATFEGVESGEIDVALNVRSDGKEGGTMKVALSGPFQSTGMKSLPELGLTATANGEADGEKIDFERITGVFARPLALPHEPLYPQRALNFQVDFMDWLDITGSTRVANRPGRMRSKVKKWKKMIVGIKNVG